MRARRKSLTEIERENFSNAIVEKFLALDVYKNSEIIMAYVSMAEEVQLQKIFVDAFNNKKILAIPFIVGKGKMLAVEVPNFDALEVGDFGILTVRQENRKFVDVKEIDCVIVPGFGGFIAHHVDARYDEDDRLWLPPIDTWPLPSPDTYLSTVT